MNLVISPVSRHFPYLKVFRNSEMTKSFEIMTFQGIFLFFLFPDTIGKGCKIRRSESWKIGMLEGQKVQVIKGFCSFPIVIIPVM